MSIVEFVREYPLSSAATVGLIVYYWRHDSFGWGLLKGKKQGTVTWGAVLAGIVASGIFYFERYAKTNNLYGIKEPIRIESPNQFGEQVQMLLP